MLYYINHRQDVRCGDEVDILSDDTPRSRRLSVSFSGDGQWDDKTGAMVSGGNLCRYLLMLVGRSPLAPLLDDVSFVQTFDGLAEAMLTSGRVSLVPFYDLLKAQGGDTNATLGVLLRAEEGLSINQVPAEVPPVLSTISPAKRTQLRLTCRVSGAEVKQALGFA